MPHLCIFIHPASSLLHPHLTCNGLDVAVCRALWQQCSARSVSVGPPRPLLESRIRAAGRGSFDERPVTPLNPSIRSVKRNLKIQIWAKIIKPRVAPSLPCMVTMDKLATAPLAPRVLASAVRIPLARSLVRRYAYALALRPL